MTPRDDLSRSLTRVYERKGKRPRQIPGLGRPLAWDVVVYVAWVVTPVALLAQLFLVAWVN